MPKPSALTANLIKAEKDSLESFKAWATQSSAASAALSAWAISEAGESPELMSASLRISNILHSASDAQTNYLNSLSGYRVSLQDVLAREASHRQVSRDREILLAKLIKTSGKPRAGAPTVGPGSLEQFQKELIACEAALRNETQQLEGVKRRVFKEAMGMRMRCLEDLGKEWVNSAREAMEALDTIGTGTGLGAVNTPAREKDNQLETLAADNASIVESLSPSHSASQVYGRGREDSNRESLQFDSARHSRSVSMTSESLLPDSVTSSVPVTTTPATSPPPDTPTTTTTSELPPAAVPADAAPAESQADSTTIADRSPTLASPASTVGATLKEKDSTTNFATPIAASVVSVPETKSADRPTTERKPTAASVAASVKSAKVKKQEDKARAKEEKKQAKEEEARAKAKAKEDEAKAKIQAKEDEAAAKAKAKEDEVAAKAKAKEDEAAAKAKAKQEVEDEKARKEVEKQQARHSRKGTSATLVVEETESESDSTPGPRTRKNRSKEPPKTKERVVVAHRGGGADLARPKGTRRTSSQGGGFEPAVEKAILGSAGRGERVPSPEGKSKGRFGFGSLFGKKSKPPQSTTATSRFLERAEDDSDAESLTDQPSPRSRRFSVFGIGGGKSSRDSTWSSRTDKNLSKIGQGEPRGVDKIKRRTTLKRSDSNAGADSDDEGRSAGGVVRVVNEGGPPLWRNRAMSDANGELERAVSIRSNRTARQRLPGHQEPPPRKALSDVGVGEWEGSGLQLRKGSKDFPLQTASEAGSIKRRKSTKSNLSRSGTIGSMSNLSVASAPASVNPHSPASTAARRRKTQSSVPKGAASLMSIVDPPTPPARSPLRNSVSAENQQQSQPPPPTPPAAIGHTNSSRHIADAPPVPLLPSGILGGGGPQLADGRARDASDNTSLLAQSMPSRSYSDATPASESGAYWTPAADPGPASFTSAPLVHSPPPTLPSLPPPLPRLRLPSDLVARTPSPSSSYSTSSPTTATASGAPQPPKKPHSILMSPSSGGSDLSSVRSVGSGASSITKRPKSVRMASHAKKTEAVYVNNPPQTSTASPAPPAVASAVARANSTSARTESPARSATSGGEGENGGWSSRIKERKEGDVSDTSDEDEDGKEYARIRKNLSRANKGLKGVA